MTWAPERVCHLESLVHGGDLSFTEIGQAMGMNKNMVIGKANRMHLTGPRSKGPSGRAAGEPTTLDDRLAALNPFPKPGGCLYGFGDVGG